MYNDDDEDEDIEADESEHEAPKKVCYLFLLPVHFTHDDTVVQKKSRKSHDDSDDFMDQDENESDVPEKVWSFPLCITGSSRLIPALLPSTIDSFPASREIAGRAKRFSAK